MKLTKEEQEVWVKQYVKEQQSKPLGLISNCCGASSKGGEDYEICSECGEHCEYNDEEYSNSNDEINISREFINEMKKNNIFVETFNGKEYFIRCKEHEDFMIYFPDDETIEIHDTKKSEQKQEFGYQDAVDYVLKNKEHLLTFDESVKERNSEMDIDSQDRQNNRAEMGGYGLG